MALFVYNSNPGAVAPDQEARARRTPREDLFVVVHDLFRTDTTDFADIVLPATTTLEHYDLHKAYGHLYLALSKPAIEPVGESKPNTEVFRLLASRMGLDHPSLRESDESIARQALEVEPSTLCRASTSSGWSARGSVRLSVPDPYAPFAQGGFPTPSGKCELRADGLAALGLDPVPTYHPPREGPRQNPEQAARYPLAFISPPAHHFLNSTFSAQPVFVRREASPASPSTRRTRPPAASPTGRMVRTFNDRGSFLAKARVSDDARPGVVVGLSIWWAKMCPGGRNANAGDQPGA